MENCDVLLKKRVGRRSTFKRVLKLSNGGPAFSIEYASKADCLVTPPLTLNLSLPLNTLQETSRIILTARDKEPRKIFEDAVQEDFDDDPDEPFLSSKSPNVITIGDEDVDVAEDALNVDNSKISSEATKEKCTLS